MSSDKTNRYDSNNDNDFVVDEFTDFQNQLNRATEEKEDPKTKILTDVISTTDKLYEQLIEDFILTYKNGQYFKQVKTIIQEKKQSIIVDYNDIIGYNDTLSEYLLSEPMEFIHKTFKNVLYSIDKDQELEYFSKEKFFNVRLINYPIFEKIRNIDVEQRDRLLSMRGIISRTGDKQPYIWKYYFKCPNPECRAEEYLDVLSKNCSHCDRSPPMVNNRSKNIYTN